MSRVSSKQYERKDFTGLLAELQSRSSGDVTPKPGATKTKTVKITGSISPEERQRASLLSNPRMRYAYSQVDNIIHDRECDVLKTIQDKDFRMLADFDTNRPTCRRCYRKAIVRSGIGDDAKRINAYVRIFDRLKATITDLRELIIENGAKLSSIDLDRVVIQVHDDRWMIRFVDNQPLLYHNNYYVLDNYQRLFSAGYHPQKDGGVHTFHNFSRIMLNYSWTEHVELLKAKALEDLQRKLRERLASVSNWLPVPHFSVFNTYYTVMDCNYRLGSFMRENGMSFRVVENICDFGSPYRLVTLRVRRWQKKRFIDATEALKEYSVVAGYYDYADKCEQRLQDLLEYDQEFLSAEHNEIA